MQVIILELIGQLVGRMEARQGKVFWAARFIFLGVLLIGSGSLILIVTSLYGTLPPAMWCGILPFLLAGIPCLVIGILLKNNP